MMVDNAKHVSESENSAEPLGASAHSGSSSVGRAPQPPAGEVTALGYGYAWLHDLIWRGTGLDLDETQLTAVARLAERKLVDLFEVAEETALANGRGRVMWHDLPLTKGLRRSLTKVAVLAQDVELKPVLDFLARAGAPGSLDEIVHAQLPRLTAALLILTAQVMATIAPSSIPPAERMDLLIRRDPGRPTPWELERAERVLDLTL